MQTSTLAFSIVLLALALPARAAWQAETRSTAIQETPLALLTGYIKPRNRPPKTAYVDVEVPPDLPWSFDWRDIPGGLTPIKNQRGCGSCWAFGTTAALEEAIKIRTGKEVILSEQEIVSCSRYGSCGGGNFAHGYQSNPGQSLASEFPYTASDQRCKGGLSHEYKIKRWGYVGSQSRRPSVDKIKAAIYKYGVLAVTVTADSNMKRYKSGIFDSCNNGGTNHIVALVGWNDLEKTWIMRNSWGESWGEGGYMRIKWGCSRIGEDATFVEFDTGEE